MATFAAFLPTLRNEFVNWDDPEMLLDHDRYRGFGWTELRWMFTTFHMGHYQPLSWLSFAFDFSLWGLNPFGFHLTNLALHSLNALACYFTARRLLRLALPAASERLPRALAISAAIAALLFALHPLRVESVAWATERRDVLSGIFYLWAIYAYLRAQPSDHPRAQGRWLLAAWVLYLLSMLSKATAITFPIVLLLLDIYPLRRINWNLRAWIEPQSRNLWREKAPFVLLAVVFAVVAIFAQQQAAALKSFESHGIGARLAQVLFGSAFYLWKTLAPLGLSPLYEIPRDFGFWSLPSLVSGIGALLVSCALFVTRNRWPAGLVCWLYYLTLLAPVLGFAQSGPQLVADRYSYLSCLSWAILAGGLFLSLLARAERSSRRFGATITLGAGALSLLVALAVLSWEQSSVWRSAETLWAHVVKLDPNSSYGHYNLAHELARKGMHQQAMHHYRQALQIRPNDVDARNNLGLLLALSGELEASLAELRRAVEIQPAYDKGYYNLGRVLLRSGDPAAAEEQLRKALQLNPREADIHLVLGVALERQARSAEAGAHFQSAVQMRPDSGDAHAALARWLAGQGKRDLAAIHYQEALRILSLRRKAASSLRRLEGAAAFPAVERNTSEAAR